MIALHRIRQATGLAFAATGVFMMVQGHALKLQGKYGPGPGFVAFWIGLPLFLVSGAWLGQLVLGRAADRAAPFATEGGTLRRIAAVIAALAAFAAAQAPLGFDLAMLGLLLFLLFAFGTGHRAAKIVVAVAGSFGLHYLFERILRVPLPSASLEPLRSLGL